jgi:hypothetical protein
VSESEDEGDKIKVNLDRMDMDVEIILIEDRRMLWRLRFEITI